MREQRLVIQVCFVYILGNRFQIHSWRCLTGLRLRPVKFSHTLRKNITAFCTLVLTQEMPFDKLLAQSWNETKGLSGNVCYKRLWLILPLYAFTPLAFS